ncbi:uncharacterized protein LOC143372115 [Andrena cerasifolii]|uniref:uncharacterized protein LOC143372115 n=1 Tax=Andrena cerasifolii TaxID=2819439 RepID=UPI004037B6E4
MNPSFQLQDEDMDAKLIRIKSSLMSHDECAQLSSLERISNLLLSGGAAIKEAVFSKLVKLDVLSTVFEILHTPSDRLLPRILEFLSWISFHRKFYECHVVMDAMDSILKVTICVLKSRDKETLLLEKLVSIIDGILNRALEFNMDFDAVCVPSQLVFLLKSLILHNNLEQKLKFSAVSLLNIVLQNIDTEDAGKDSLFELCHKALDLMKEIVEYSDDAASIPLAAIALCSVCASGTRLCAAESDTRGSFDKAIQSRESLTKAIYTTAMNTLIPCGKSAESNETDRVKFHRNLVTCLNSLYKLSNCSRDNLSNHLTGNGYLKYFLLLTTRLPENLRRSTCILLSRIITTLAEESLSIGHWPNGVTAFENLMHRGLLDLPRDVQQWSDVMSSEGNSSIALMVLIYYHFHATKETDMLPLSSMILRIMNLPNSVRIPVPILKVLWFLFAIASVSHPSPNVEQGYDRASKRLASLLQYSKLSDCYTHHIDLIRYCLESAEIPRDLRNKAMDLWLIESDGDIKPLLTLDCDKVVRRCLLLAIQTGHSEQIINLAMKGIREMIRADNAKEIAEIAWHMLPNLLCPYQPGRDEQVKAVLELTNVFIPDSLSLSIKSRCADSLMTIILRRDANLKLRTLASMHSYVLLVTSATTKPFTIFKKYIGTRNFLEELLAQGFSDETPEFAAVCLKLLAFIVHCQAKSSVQRDKAVNIDVQRLADLLLNTRESVHCSINGMQLALELLTADSDGSAVRLSGIASSGDEAWGVVNLYETLHIIHGKSDSTQKDVVYQCLEGVLRFCQNHVESLMYHLCTLMSNYDLVTRVLQSSYVPYHFLEFLSTWLRCRRSYCTDEGPWNPRSLCRTPFEETLEQITTYVNAVGNTRADAAFYNLRYAVGHLLR